MMHRLSTKEEPGYTSRPGKKYFFNWQFSMDKESFESSATEKYNFFNPKK